jgi:drug/metabolite transporter superfamily protein YnfA
VNTVPSKDPLDREHVTEGSADVLPAYGAVFTVVGLIFLLQGSDRTSSPAFDSAKWTLQWTPHPMRAWGLIFLAVGVWELWCWFRSFNRRLFRAGMLVGLGVAAFWATLLVTSPSPERPGCTS